MSQLNGLSSRSVPPITVHWHYTDYQKVLVRKEVALKTKQKAHVAAKTVVDRLALAYKQNQVCSSQSQNKDGRSCFGSAIGSIQNSWLSPSASQGHLYGHNGNMMFDMPAQMAMLFPPHGLHQLVIVQQMLGILLPLCHM